MVETPAATKLTSRSESSCHTRTVGGTTSHKPWARLPDRAFQDVRLPHDMLVRSGETITLQQWKEGQ